MGEHTPPKNWYPRNLYVIAIVNPQPAGTTLCTTRILVCDILVDEGMCLIGPDSFFVSQLMIAKTKLLANHVRKGLWRNSEDHKLAFHRPKSRALLLKHPKMARMAGVTQAKAWWQSRFSKFPSKERSLRGIFSNCRSFKGQHNQGQQDPQLWDENVILRGALRGPLKTSKNL